MLLESRKLLERSARWLLRNRSRPLDIGDGVARFRDGIREVAACLDTVVSASMAANMGKLRDALVADAVPADLAARVSLYGELFSALDIVEVSAATGRGVEEVAAVYLQLGERLHLHWMRDQIVQLPRENRWQALSREALRDDLYAQERVLTADVLRLDTSADTPAARIDAWMHENSIAVQRCQQILGDLMAVGHADFTMLSVAMGEIRGMQQANTEPAKRPKGSKKKGRSRAA